jgi:hypothetical protein
VTRPRAPKYVVADLEQALDYLKSLAGHEGHDRYAGDHHPDAARFLDSWVLPLVQRSYDWAANEPQPPEHAVVNGHDLEWDPPMASSAVRWTCRRTGCRMAAIQAGGSGWYGTAMTELCMGTGTPRTTAAGQ